MNPTHLVYLVHADPSVRPRYVAELSAAGIRADVVAFVGPPVPGLPGGGLSARYDSLGTACRILGKGSVLQGLAKRYPPPRPLSSYEYVLVATYSAGYGLARQLTEQDRAQLHGLVLIDSGHGPEGLKGAALDWLVPWAQAARKGSRVLAIGITDVDPVTYASTTEVAEAAIALSGEPLADLTLDPGAELGLVRRQRDTGFVVERYNRHPAAKAKSEHADALTVWGPSLVAQACAIAMGTGGGVGLPAVISVAAIDRTEPQETGSKPPISAAQSIGHSHGYRCSVAELVADAKALGRLHLAVDVRAGRYAPKIGDLVIGARAGGDPLLGGSGHVERIVAAPAQLPPVALMDGHMPIASPGDRLPPMTVGGNEGNAWTLGPYDIDSRDFRAVIEVDERLGAKAVELALGEMAAGVREKPGAAHHDRIQAYHAGARRKGSPLAGMPGHELEGGDVLGDKAPDETAWCASGASWCAYQAARLLAQ